MKRFNFIQRLILCFTLSFLLVSCGTSLQTGIRQVQLDMSKQEVISILGNEYQVLTMQKTDQGYLEILRYTTNTIQDNKYVPSYYYILHFLDGKLVVMDYEDAAPSIIPQPPHKHPK